MLRIVVIFCFFFTAISNAQSIKENGMIEVGYVHFNGNFFKIGGKYFFSNTFSSAGLSANVGYLKNKMLVIPELAFTRYLTKEKWKNFKNEHFVFTQLAISPKTITTKIGWSLATFLEVSAGYGIDLSTSDYYNTKGFRFDVCVAIALDLKIM